MPLDQTYYRHRGRRPDDWEDMSRPMVNIEDAKRYAKQKQSEGFRTRIKHKSNGYVVQTPVWDD